MTTTQAPDDTQVVPEDAHVPDTRRLSPEADPASAPEIQPADATLYERLGGCYGIAGAVDILVDRLFQNVKVNANEIVHKHHGNPANAAGYKWLVTSWSIEAAGGPKCYIGHDMGTAHEHLAIDKAGFDAVAKEIEATLDFVGVPDPELRGSWTSSKVTAPWSSRPDLGTAAQAKLHAALAAPSRGRA